MLNKFYNCSISIILFISVFIYVGESVGENANKTTINDKVKQTSKYKIIYTLDKVRYDGGKNYYVLIDPVNLSDDTFKASIKKIIRKIVSEKGDKISIDIFDDRKALDIHYRKWGIMEVRRNFTKQEVNILEEHHIAGFSGELETDAYLNTLYFFSETGSSHPKVGRYVEYPIKFNPRSQ